MDQVPTWLAAAIDAAGVSTVYNADDWDRRSEANQNPRTEPEEPANPPGFD